MSEAVLKQKTLKVVEIFGPTIQGEGAFIGRPTIFVRFGGCDYRCIWCDSMHAVDKIYQHEWDRMTADEILSEVNRISEGRPILITISGGNPAIQNLNELLDKGHAMGHEFSMETQGSVAKEWFGKLDQISISPKPPSSKEATDWDKLDQSIEFAKDTKLSLKIVIFNDEDYQYARKVQKKYPDLQLFLSIGNEDIDEDQGVDPEKLHAKMRELVDWTVRDGWYDVTILPQLHVLLWGNQKGV